ncbi:MAG TPA: hypothetical protein VMV37_06630 [Gammaproteobacteria bacterium]|nr:hypothetical protein [Gammaproteobacteria bacterium]
MRTALDAASDLLRERETPAQRRKCFRGNNSDLALESMNGAAGLTIDARTSRCRWLGERMDYSLAIEGMQWREANAAARGCDAPPPG